MVFGFNNFNMMNMFPMNFGSFGFGSFGCGTGYSNFGSSLFGCGFGNNYLNPTNCDGSTNWGAVGFGLTAAFAPMLLNWGVGAVEKAIQNSNGNQQEVVAGDIDVLQGRVDEALKELGSGVTVENYKEYDIDTKEPKFNNDITRTTNAYNEAKDKTIPTLVEAVNEIQSQIDQLDTSANDYNTKLSDLQRQKREKQVELDAEKAKIAEPDGELYKAKAEAEKAKADRVEAIGLQKIKIEKAIKELKKAQAELEELRLDDYDGTAIQRTRKEDFVKRFNISNDKEFSYNDINNVTKSDVLYIINQYKTATPENKEKWKTLLGNLWKDNGLDPDIRNSSDCRGGYKLICCQL